jgi:hypothetical protein
MGSNTVHGPAAQQTMTQHPNRFWMPTCFDDSCRLRRNFEVELVLLEALWNSGSNHIYNVQIPLCMWPGRQFSWSQVLECEVELKSSWTWTPPWCGSSSSSSLTPWPYPSLCWSSPLFLINKTFMEPSVNSEKQLTSLERTWRSNCRTWDLVIGPCIVCKWEIFSSSSPS